MSSSQHYDVNHRRLRPGGGTMAWKLAQTGKRILLLERGDYLKRGRENWDTKAVFIDGIYQAKETWYSSKGDTFHPGLHYFVGGNSKVYGSVLSGCASAISARSSIPTASRPLGRSATTCSSRTTRRRRSCSRCTETRRGPDRAAEP